MLNTSNEKKQYLANIISVVRADGKITSSENSAIEIIQKNINAKKSELTQAFQLAENPAFQIKLVGIFSDKIKNIEDIVFVSLIDGSLDDSERLLLLKIASEVKISQEQFDLILNEIANQIASSKSIIKCQNCGAEILPNAKFCSECGNAIIEESNEETVSVSYEIPRNGITIEFAESTSAGFADAIKEQSAAPINKTCIKAKKTWYLASWEVKDISTSLKLVENLKGMRNRKVYIDGQEARWDEVFGFSWCAEQRNTAYKPIEYCFGLDEKRFNIWGCKQTRMEWNEWNNWFTYGKWEKVGMLKNQVKFVFDKEQIKHELKTNLFRCRYCPHIKFNLIDAIIDAFPDEVIPTDNGPWTYKSDYNESPGAIKVKVKTTEDGYTFTNEFYSSGVVPKSISIGIDILKKAVNSINIDKNEIKAILDYTG